MHWIFFFNDTATTEIYTLSLHDALPIYDRDHHLRSPGRRPADAAAAGVPAGFPPPLERSEEHTSELQSRQYLVCRLLFATNKSLSPSSISLIATSPLFLSRTFNPFPSPH